MIALPQKNSMKIPTSISYILERELAKIKRFVGLSSVS